MTAMFSDARTIILCYSGILLKYIKESKIMTAANQTRSICIMAEA